MNRNNKLLFVVAAAVLAVAVGCGPKQNTSDSQGGNPSEIPSESTQSQHTHVYSGDWTITEAPTLTNPGKATRPCADCDVPEEVTVPALSDANTWTKEETPADCDKDGKTVYTSTYGTIELKGADKLEHVYGAYTITQNPTLTEKGKATRTCSLCNTVDTVDVPALSDSAWTKEETKPTCTTKGHIEYTSIYGVIDMDGEDAKGHAYGAYTITEAPTESATGKATRTCSVCEEVEEVVVPALSDAATWAKEETPATCTADGKIKYTSIYGSIETKGADKLPHNFGAYTITNAPTLTTAGDATRTCADCGEVQQITVPALADEHTWTKEVTEPTCDSKGSIKYTSVYGEVTIDGADKLEHVWSAWEIGEGEEPTEAHGGYAYRECTLCGEEDEAEVAKLTDTTVWSLETIPATCTTNGKKIYTSIYGTIELPGDAATGHTYGAWKVPGDSELGAVVTATKDCESNDDQLTTQAKLPSSFANAVSGIQSENGAPESYTNGMKVYCDAKSDTVYPWSYNEKSGAYSSTNKGFSGTNAILYMSFESDGVLTFDWHVSAEYSCSFFTPDDPTGDKTCAAPYVAGYPVAEGSVTMNVEAGKVYSFKYYRATAAMDGDDIAKISNVKFASNSVSLEAVSFSKLSFNTNSDSTIGDQLVVLNGPVGALPTPEKAGYTFDGWYVDEELKIKATATTVLTDDTTFYAKWLANKTITVVYNNGSENGSIIVPEGKTGDAGKPAKQGFKFLGWYTDEELTIEWDSTLPVTQDFSIYAKWEEAADITGTYVGGLIEDQSWKNASYTVSSLKTVTVTDTNFTSSEGSSFGQTITDYNEETGIISGKDNLGWDAYLMYKDDIMFQILYAAPNSYTSPDSMGQIRIYVKTINNNPCVKVSYSAVDNLKTPTGWSAQYYFIDFEYEDGTVKTIYYGGSEIYTDLTLEDAYGHKLKATDVAQGSDTIVKNSKGEVIFSVGYNGKNLSALQTTGTFTGTYTNGDEKITFNGNTASGQSKYYDAEGNKNSYTPIAGQDKFYVIVNNEYYEYTLDVENKTFTKEKKIYTVTYVTNGAEAHAQTEVGPTTALGEAYYTPTQEGKFFKGWYLTEDFSGSPVTATYVPTGDVTLYAKWADPITLTFATNGADAKDPISVEPGVALGSNYYEPTKEGQLFRGWYTTEDFSGAPISSTYAPAESVTLYAKWVNPVSVTYVYNNGTANKTTEYGVGDVPNTANPTRSGYAFGGWYSDEELTTPWDKSAQLGAENITVYAKWVELEIYAKSSYKVYAYYSSNSASTTTLSSSNVTTTITFQNDLTSNSTAYKLTSYDKATGAVTMTINSNSTYKGYIDQETGVIIVSGNNRYFYVLCPTSINASSAKGDTGTVGSAVTNGSTNGKIRFFTYVKGGKTYNVFSASNGDVYVGVTFKTNDTAQTNLAASACSKSSKGVLVYDKNGTCVAAFEYNSSKSYVVASTIPTPHTHEFGAWTIKIAPTSKQEGSAERVCECGEKETATVPALNDTTVWTETITPATCLEAGHITYTSSVWGTVTIEDYPEALGHTYSNWTITVNPTLETAGSASRTCATCEHVDTTAVPALNDETVWTPVVTAPTHTEAGYTTYTSETWGSIVVAGDPATGHTNESTDYKAIITEDGKVIMTKYCIDDGAALGEPVKEMAAKQGATLLSTTETISTTAWDYNEETGEWHSQKPANSNSSWLEFTAQTAGEVKIIIRVSSEKSYDGFGIQLLTETTTTETKYYGDSSDTYLTYEWTATVKEGDKIKIRYFKDGSGDKGSDDAYIKFAASEFTYNVATYNSNGGTACAPSFIENGAIVGDLPATTQEGKYFEGWYTDAECTVAYSASNPLSGNATLYAKWSDAQYVTFNVGEGATEIAPLAFQKGTTPVGIQDATKDGYVFLGWYTDAECTTEYTSANAEASFTLYAKWYNLADTHALYGNYAGFKVYSWSSSTQTLSESYTELSVEVDGSYSLRTNYSSYKNGTSIGALGENGVLTTSNNGTAYYLADSKTIVIAETSPITTSTSIYVLTKDATSSKAGVAATSITLGSSKLGLITYGDNKAICIDFATGAIYANVSLLDLDNNALSIAQIKTETVAAFKVKLADNTEVIYGKKSNTEITTTLDAYAGNYTAADGETISVAGTGKAAFSKAGTSLATYEVLNENELYVSYSSTIRYLVTLNKETKSFTYVERKITLTYDYGYEVDGHEYLETEERTYSVYTTIPTAKRNPTRDGYLFDGWYTEPNGAGTNVTTANKALTENTTFYASWKAALTLTVNNNNGTDPVSSSFMTGSVPSLTTPTKEGYIFVGWYTDAECTVAYVSEAKTENVTVYAKWVEAPAFVGSYYGFNSDDGANSGYTERTASSSSASITATGSVSGRWSTTWSLENVDTTTNTLVCANNSKIQWLVANDGQVFMLFDYSAGSNYACDDDFMLYAKGVSSNAMKTKTIYWLDGYRKIIEITIGENSYNVYIDGYHSSKNPTGGLAYIDVTFKNFSGEAMTFAQICDSSTKVFADELVVYANDGTTVLGSFGGGTTAGFVNDDGKKGAYTGTIDGVTSSVTLNGFGKATVKIGEAEAIDGSYSFSSDTLTIVYEGKTKSFTVGAENALTQVLDGKQGTYTVGDSGSLQLTGWGACTLDGTSGTYEINGSFIVVTIADVTTYYTLDTEANTASVVSLSKFSGLTFSGTHKDTYNDDETMLIVCNTGSDISGYVQFGGASFKANFTGTYEDGVLVITYTSDIYGNGLVGKTATFTAENGKLTCTASERTSGTYAIQVGTVLNCAEFVA